MILQFRLVFLFRSLQHWSFTIERFFLLGAKSNHQIQGKKQFISRKVICFAFKCKANSGRGKTICSAEIVIVKLGYWELVITVNLQCFLCKIREHCNSMILEVEHAINSNSVNKFLLKSRISKRNYNVMRKLVVGVVGGSYAIWFMKEGCDAFHQLKLSSKP